MYTEKEFRKDYPVNKMITKVNDKKFFVANLVNAANESIKLLVMAALSNYVLPTDILEFDIKSAKADELNQQYVEMHEKYDVTHEEIVGLDF